MKIDSFSKEELDYYKSLNLSANDLKDRLQTDIINRSIKEGKRILFMFYTGFGKTRTGTKFIRRYLTKFPNSKINVVSPTLQLRKMWEKEDKVQSKVINSFTMKMTDEERNCDLLIVDELHHCLNKDSKYFSNLLLAEANYKIGLSATLSDKQLKFLKDNNFDYVFKFSVIEGNYLELIPEYQIVNVPVDFTNFEKAAFVANREIINKYISMFEIVLEEFTDNIELYEYYLQKLISSLMLPSNINSKILDKNLTAKGWLYHCYNKLTKKGYKIADVNSILGVAKKIRIAMNSNEELINNAYNKYSTLVDIFKTFKDEKRKSLVFTKLKNCSIIINSKLKEIGVKSRAYDSSNKGKEKSNILVAFEENLIDNLVCINELKEGYDLPDISLIIRHSMNGTQVDAQQILGRGLRIDVNNPNKKLFLINLFVEDFIYKNVKIETGERKKLEYAYKGLSFTYFKDSDLKNIKNEKDDII